MGSVSDWFARQQLIPTRYGSGGPYEASIGYSRVVRAGELAWTAGTTATVDGELQGLDDAGGQTEIALGQALAALERAGVARHFVVQSRLFVVNIRENADAVGRAHGAVFSDIRPAATMVGVTELIDPRMLVEVELLAVPGRLMRSQR